MPTGPRDAIASESSPAEPSAPSGPRFAVGGTDAEEYGARDGYPISDRAHLPFPTSLLVGSYSHLDQVFEG